MAYRYYATQRPVVPGSVPDSEDNPIIEVSNLDSPAELHFLGKVWGYVEYNKPLEEDQWRAYELAPSGCSRYYRCMYRRNDDGTGFGKTLGSIITNDPPEGRTRRCKTYTLIEKWLDMPDQIDSFCKTGYLH